MNFSEQLAQFEKIHKDFRLIVGSNGTAEGSLKHGHAICATCPDGGTEDTGPIPPPPPPPENTGACCFEDGTCNVETEAECADDGGTYQGDDVTCEEADCPQPTGACCFEDGACDIETEDECADSGGTYQGDDVTCEEADCPQPSSGACCHADGSCTIEPEADCDGMYKGDGTICEFASCCNGCGYSAFDGSGRTFRRYERSITSSFTIESHECPGGDDLHVSASGTAHYEQHKTYSDEEGCVTTTDDDTSSSTKTIDQGATHEECSFGSLECLCSVVIPDHNQCTDFGNYCQCGEEPPGVTVDESADSRTTTVDLSVRSCTHGCVPSGEEYTCDWVGTYVVTETLSEECMV